MVRRLMVLIVVASSFVVSTVEAQRYGRYGDPYYSDNRASTPGESYARGIADMTRAAGQANLLNSKAAGNYEDARTKQLDNRLKTTDTYFEMRRVNREARKAERRPPASSEVAFRRAREVTPDELTATQLDRVTGKIEWPRLLMDERYAETRGKLDRLYAARSDASGNIGMDTYQRMLATCDRLKAELKKNIRDYLPNDYIKATQFIDSLAFEARYPAG